MAVPEHEAHDVELLEGARALFPRMVAAIDAARIEVALETYIFDTEGEAASVAEALLRAAGRGVVVRLVVDGIGTGRLPEDWAGRFERGGVQVRVFSPIGLFGLLYPSRWRRLHRKLCVVDGVIAFCGGINILDDWFDPNFGKLNHPRLDFAVCVRGVLAAEIRRTTARLWQRIEALREARGSHLSAAMRKLRAPEPHTAALVAAQHSERQRAAQAAAAAPSHADPHRQTTLPSGTRAALLLGDNLRHRRRIERAYRHAIGAARHDIVIACAYFLPGRKLRRALLYAARRGVRVQLLLQGRYEYFLQYHGVRPVYQKLLAAGIEIHEYAPSFLHAKVAVIDADGARPWATVGSANLDPLSLLLAREANVVIESNAFCIALRERLQRVIRDEGKRIEAEALLSRPWRERALDRVAAALMRAGLWLAGQQGY